MSEHHATFRPIDKWPRLAETKGRRRSPFKVGYQDTLELLFFEIAKLGGSDVVVQIDVREHELRLDGWPKSDARPKSPRVIVSLKSKHGPLMYPCDQFLKWQDNLRAIALALEALRKVDRYGVTSHGEQYKGWQALPAPSDGGGFTSIEKAANFIARHCDHLPLDISGRFDTFRDAYRIAALKLHPDRNNGDMAEFKKLQQARELINIGFGRA